MKKSAVIGVALTLLAIGGLLAIQSVAAGAGERAGCGGCAVMAQGHDHSGTGHDAAAEAKPPAAEPKLADVAKAQAGKLAEALAALDAAKKAVESGDKNAGLAAVEKARAAVVSARENVARFLPQAVNARCPIMGGAIDPATVTDALIRDYKGQKVGFCCGGCPAEWDKLSDADKDAKLSKSLKAEK